MIDISGASGRLKAIYTYLTSYLSATRCAKIDNLDAAMSTRAAAATALSSATWTAARAGYLEKLNATPGIPGTLKSVQRGVISMASGDSTKSATIASVDTGKAVLTLLGTAPSGTSITIPAPAYLELTSATTITAKKTYTDKGVAVAWQVAEHY